MSKRKTGGFIQIKDVLDDMIRDMRIGDKMNEMNVRKHWHELMGTYITNHTQKIYFNRGKIFIYIESSALKQELYLAKAKIISSLNERLQENLVHDIIIR